MAKRGPKPKTIDWNIFENLCSIQCTLLEMCTAFDMDDVTLQKLIKKKYGMKFSEVFALKRGAGVTALRRAQFRLAVEDRNPTMLIFLGKNYAGQTDKVETFYTNKDDLKYEIPESMKVKE